MYRTAPVSLDIGLVPQTEPSFKTRKVEFSKVVELSRRYKKALLELSRRVKDAHNYTSVYKRVESFLKTDRGKEFLKLRL